MSLRLAWFFLVLVSSVSAQDASLREIRALLLPMRTNPIGSGGPRGATPALTEIKHKLRDWIESRLHEFRYEGEEQALALELNAEIRKAGLSCNYQAGPGEQQCPAWWQLGYLGSLRATLSAGLLVVITGVGIECGYDESAYLYQFADGRWRRFWQSEQDDYREDRYKPQNLLIASVSGRDFSSGADPNSLLILTLGREPWCSSNWHDVDYRAWRVRLDRPDEEPLLDGSEEAGESSPVDVAVKPREVLIEYSVHTTYTDALVRREVRHYALKGGRLEREAPLALSPRDFADEWMKTEWSVSSQWTSAESSASSLQGMHRKENFEGGAYSATIHCEKRPEHWEVPLTWDRFDETTNTMVTTKHMYLLVRWLPPYRFSMSGVSDHPWPGCTEEDPEADKERSLFPVHQW
jgi:hypothetical protein